MEQEQRELPPLEESWSILELVMRAVSYAVAKYVLYVYNDYSSVYRTSAVPRWISGKCLRMVTTESSISPRPGNKQNAARDANVLNVSHEADSCENNNNESYSLEQRKRLDRRLQVLRKY